jgi:hypothetical protein
VCLPSDKYKCKYREYFIPVAQRSLLSPQRHGIGPTAAGGCMLTSSYRIRPW